jgi:DNA polymerase-3 subunit beta
MANTVIATREVTPVLRNFLFEVDAERLRITASNLELTLITTTEMVTTVVAGTAVFPHRKLMDIVKEAGDGDVTIKVTGGLATISVDRTSWSLKLMTGHDWPPMPPITETVMTAVEREKFLTAIQTVRYAACKDSGSRGPLMMIDVRDGKMTACDGSRFHQARTTAVPFDFRLPIGAVEHLVRLLKLCTVETIQVGESKNHLIFGLGRVVFIVGKLVAQFPDLESTWLRPALENKHRLIVDKTALLTAVRRVRINADANTSAIALALTPQQGGRLTVTTRDAADNDASETIEVGWNSPERTIVVNHGYLVDLLKHHPDQSCTFRLGDDTKTRKSPLLLRDEHSATTGVVQQMLVDWSST